MSDIRYNKIKCPFCGCEYHPSEIFIPGAMLGKPTKVIKDALGKIIYDDYDGGKKPDFTETYICDSCEKMFVVEATITYKTMSEIEELDFNNPYASLLDE